MIKSLALVAILCGCGAAEAAPSIKTLSIRYARPVTCTGSYVVTGTSAGATSLAWATVPSGDSGACTGTDAFSCTITVAPDAPGEGVETATITATGSTGSTSISADVGFYVAGARSCFLSQNVDGSFNATLGDFGVVSTWVDLGSQGKNLTQSSATAKPVLRLDVGAIQPAVKADGGDRLVGAAAADWAFLTDGNDATGSILYLSRSDTANVDVMATHAGAGTTTSGFFLRQSTAETGSFNLNVNATVVLTKSTSAGAMALNAAQSLDFVIDDDGGAGVDLTLYLNGASQGTAVRASTYPATPTNPLQALANPTIFNLTGFVFRMLLYASALTSTQIEINDAVDEWAVGGALPFAVPGDVVPGQWLFVGDSLSADGRAVASYASKLFAMASGKSYVNVAVSGVATNIILAQWRFRDPHYPTTVFVLGGSNDINAGANGTTAAANLALITASAKAAGSQTVCMTPPPFGSAGAWTAPKQTQMDALVAGILADANCDLIVNFNVLLADPILPLNLNPIYNEGDGIHLNEAGTAFMASSVATALGL